MQYREKLNHIPDTLLSLTDYERVAEDFIPPDVYTYICAGVADEITLTNNAQAFAQYSIVPRLLTSFSQANSHCQLFGQPLPQPIMLAPVAHHALVHPQAEIATAEGADAVDTPMVASTLSSRSLEDIAAATRGPKWFQLYFQRRREDTAELLERAERAGFKAIVVTADAPISGLRTRIQRSGFQGPSALDTENLKNMEPAPVRELEVGQSVILNGMMSEAPTWDELAWLRTKTQLPLLLKGVLHPEDAAHAQAIGLDGVIVSNHGGRTLDGIPASIDVLPAIRERVGGVFPLLLDSGIRRGTDVFVALARGANAVLVGRPQLYALSIAGALGVAHMLKLLQDELHVAMALAGCATLDDVRHATIRHQITANQHLW